MSNIIQFPKQKKLSAAEAWLAGASLITQGGSAKVISLDFTKTVNAFREYIITLEKDTGYKVKTDEFEALILTKPTLYQLQEYIQKLHVSVQVWLNMLSQSINDKPIC